MDLQPGSTARTADLVLEGGGVRGIGLVGAVTALADAGYAFPRVAGSSAGAIVASIVAALQKAGAPLTELEGIVKSVDYRRFTDSTLVGRVPFAGRLLELLTTDGLYKGDYLEQFIADTLKQFGVVTFGDLLYQDPQASPTTGYSLVTTASDLTKRRFLRVPEDLPGYGIDPDTFSVARAVRASAAIPFFFEPVQIGSSTCVDGGLLSDFPVALFDRQDGAPPRWPTFGVRLRASPDAGVLWGPPTDRPVHGPLGIGITALESLLSAQDASYVDLPSVVARTVFVDASAVNPVNFRITAAATDALFEKGVGAGRSFLARWEFDRYVETYRP